MRSDGRPLNLLFLCADDHRWDALGGPYLGAHPAGLKTPAWDRLAREGAHLTHCFTTVPICTPARAELLTGCDAFRTGVRWFGEKTDPTLETLAGVFGRSGYETFFTGKWHNDGTPGERGYARTRRVKVGGMWDHRLTFEENGRKVTGFSTELFAEAAIEFLREPQRRERPWYAHVAFTAPHDPRTPPASYRPNPKTLPLPANYMPLHPFDNGEMTIRDEQLAPWPRTAETVRAHLADYYGMVRHLDAQMGHILDALERTGQAKNTIVIYTGDHGLAVGSHGLMGKMSMYDHSVRVPLILRGPGIPGGRRSGALCQSMDVLPTLCDLCGVATPATAQGHSLSAVLSGKTDTHRDAVFGAYRDVQRMVRTDRFKYVEYPRTGRRQLFDLETDPHELSDLLEDWRYAKTQWYAPPTDGTRERDLADRLRSRLREWQSRVEDPVSWSAPVGP